MSQTVNLFIAPVHGPYTVGTHNSLFLNQVWKHLWKEKVHQTFVELELTLRKHLHFFPNSK